MSDALERISASLQAIERRLDAFERRLDAAIDPAPGAIATAVDALDAHVAALGERGVDVDAHARGAVTLLGAITAPEVVRTLELLLTRLAAIEAATAAMAQAPAMVGALVDTIDHTVGRLAEQGIDVDARLRALVRAAERLTREDTLTAVGALLDSGLLGPEAVAVLGKVGAAVAVAGAAPPDRVGAFGLMRALRDPDVQRAAGFLIQIARQLGRQLAPSPAQLALTD